MKLFSKANSWALALGILVSLAAQAAEGDLVTVKGNVSGFTDITTDNLVDGAIVLPSLSADDLFQFQIEQFMGPPETMTVGGLFTAEVPANFYFPKQKEKYGIFPVSFGKESFSLEVLKGQKRELVAAWFQIPWDKLLDMNNNHLPPTAMLPLLNIKKHGYLPEKDWSTVSSIAMKLDKDLGTKLKFDWDRPAVTGSDMDSVVLFQATSTNRWVFANLKGNPARKGEIQSMKGMADNFKVMFMRTHTTDQDVTSAEGHVRGAVLADTVTVVGIPPALDGKLKGSKVVWTPIQTPGWISLTIAPKAEPVNTLFSINNFFGSLFAKVEDSVQMWLDPKQGTTSSLSSNSTQDTAINLAFIGTTTDVAMPEEGADNTAFLEAASEIRMNKIQ
jgi:hypothetical protein